MNMMMDIANDRYQTVFFKFFLKKINKKIQYQQIASMQADKFIELVQKEPIFSILVTKFLPLGCNLVDELNKVTYNIYLIKFPKQIGGITLKTQQIDIQYYKNKSKDHIMGAQFIIYLHELGHYLQRVLLNNVRSTFQSLSPRLDSNLNITEGGNYLEKLLFCDCLKEISLNQAKLLINGEFPDSLISFQAMFKDSESSIQEDNIRFRRASDAINLRNCGSSYGILI